MAGPQSDLLVNKESIEKKKFNSPSTFPVPSEKKLEVLDHFDEDYIVNPELIEIIRKAHAYYDEKKDQEALDLYFKVLEKVQEDIPHLFDVYKNIGNIYLRNKDVEAAEEFYHRAYVMNSESDILLVNMGTLEIQRENYEKAKELFRLALTKDGRNEKAWIGLALVHRHYGDLDLSWANLMSALDQDPENETAYQLFIDWGVKDGRWTDLISFLEGARGERALTLARIYIHLGQLKNAKALLEGILEQDSIALKASELLSEVQQKLEQQECPC
ncbi:MAG: hypothetical protein D6797_09345 [Bdellovibrio sp.]|nr:MAG: hypothetical protein D6797_09345 [Bdellovibrio sp.]